MTRFLALIAVALAITAFVAMTQPTPAVAQFGEQAAQPGRGCTRNSDCNSPLVCFTSSGSCRYQCQENRDCGVGQHCVRHSAAGGSCALDSSGYVPPDAAYCVATRDCTSGACGRNNQCGG
jgi:hypothetical protein